MSERVLMKGNEAMAEAAIRAGCRHFFGYPITPQTEVAAYMSKKMPKIGSEVGTPEGKGVVVSENMLKMQVRVKIENKDGSLVYKDFPLEQIVFKGGKREDPDDKADKDLKNLLD